MTGKVKWFNAEKAMVLSKEKAARTYSFTSPVLKAKALKPWKKAGT